MSDKKFRELEPIGDTTQFYDETKVISESKRELETEVDFKKIPEIYEKRTLTDEEISQHREKISNWGNSIPHHDLKNLGNLIEITTAEEIPAYFIYLWTQYEKRELRDGKRPYRNENIPPKVVTPEKVDLWSYNVPIAEDFTEKVNTYEIPNSHEKSICAYCSGSGQEVCSSCGGVGTEKCRYCNGLGKKVCHICGGDGQIERTEYTSSGRSYTTSEKCYSCRGGYNNCTYCNGGRITCIRCDGRGRLICGICEGYGNLVGIVSSEIIFLFNIDSSLHSLQEIASVLILLFYSIIGILIGAVTGSILLFKVSPFKIKNKVIKEGKLRWILSGTISLIVLSFTTFLLFYKHEINIRYFKLYYPNVIVQTAPLRLANGPFYPEVGKAQKGMRYKIISETQNWMKIQLETGKIGWLWKKLQITPKHGL